MGSVEVKRSGNPDMCRDCVESLNDRRDLSGMEGLSKGGSGVVELVLVLLSSGGVFCRMS